jgi:hypothetical protein
MALSIATHTSRSRSHTERGLIVAALRRERCPGSRPSAVPA